MREDRDSLVERLHRQTAEYSAFKLENERLKVWMHGECRGHGQAASWARMSQTSSEAWARTDKMGVPWCWGVCCRAEWHLVSLLQCRGRVLPRM